MAAVLFAAAVGTARADGPADGGEPHRRAQRQPKELVDFIMDWCADTSRARDGGTRFGGDHQGGRQGHRRPARPIRSSILPWTERPRAAAQGSRRIRGRVGRSGNETAAQVAHSRVLLIQLPAARTTRRRCGRRLDEVKKFLDTPPLAPGAWHWRRRPANLSSRSATTKLAAEAYKSCDTASPPCRRVAQRLSR